MKNKQILAALALDLRRVAIGYHRGSIKMAERFLKEAIERKQEVDVTTIRPYLKNYLDKIDERNNGSVQKKAEEFLTYSILFQNAATSLAV